MPSLPFSETTMMICRTCALLSMCSILCAAQLHTVSLNEFNKHLNSDFNDMDLDKNGVVDVQEMEQRIQRQDYDNVLVTYVILLLRRFVWVLFNHFDHNKDDCLEIQDQVDEFHEIDIKPKDGAVTILELDAYYDRLFQKILPGLIQSS